MPSLLQYSFARLRHHMTVYPTTLLFTTSYDCVPTCATFSVTLCFMLCMGRKSPCLDDMTLVSWSCDFWQNMSLVRLLRLLDNLTLCFSNSESLDAWFSTLCCFKWLLVAVGPGRPRRKGVSLHAQYSPGQWQAEHSTREQKKNNNRLSIVSRYREEKTLQQKILYSRGKGGREGMMMSLPPHAFSGNNQQYVSILSMKDATIS